MNINEIKPNPNNPRIIKDDKFKKLVKSIQDFPQMLELRPIVIDKNNIVLGGNMRLKACKEAGLTDVPVIYAKDLTEEQKKEFIIADNVSFGDHDWEMLANQWDANELSDWGIDVPTFNDLSGFDDIEDLKATSENAPKGTDDGYSTFELVMLHENKLTLLDTINQVKTNYLFEKMEDALMEIIRVYNKQ